MSDRGLVHPPKGTEQQARAAKITNEIDSMQTQPPVQLPREDDAGATANFPAMLIPRDTYDDTYAQKARNAAPRGNPYNPAQPVQFVQEITKEDLDYQKRKQEVVNNLRYKTWLTNAIDMSDPAQVYLAREKGILTDYYDDREKLIDYWHDVSARIAKMRLLGRSSWGPEDYKLAYAIKTGVLRLPSGSLMNPESYKLGQADEGVNRARGFFNPFRLFRGWKSNYLRTNEDPFPDLSGVPLGANDAAHAPFGILNNLMGGNDPANYATGAPVQLAGGLRHL